MGFGCWQSGRIAIQCFHNQFLENPVAGKSIEHATRITDS